MYKYFGLIISIIALQAHAYTSCAGGREITANVHNAANAPAECTPETCPSSPKTFCIGPIISGKWNIINWWSAEAWCQSNGGHLASFASMCPGISAPVNGQICPALKTGQIYYSDWAMYGWSNMGVGTTHAILVQLKTGEIQKSTSTNGRKVGYNYTNQPRVAVCE